MPSTDQTALHQAAALGDLGVLRVLQAQNGEWEQETERTGMKWEEEEGDEHS